MLALGHTGCGSSSAQIQYKAGQVCLQDEGSTGDRCGCPSDAVGPFLPNVCPLASLAASASVTQYPGGENTGNYGSSSFTQEANIVNLAVAGPTFPARSPVLVANFESCFTVTGFDGMVITEGQKALI